MRLRKGWGACRNEEALIQVNGQVRVQSRKLGKHVSCCYSASALTLQVADHATPQMQDLYADLFLWSSTLGKGVPCAQSPTQTKSRDIRRLTCLTKAVLICLGPEFGPAIKLAEPSTPSLYGLTMWYLVIWAPTPMAEDPSGVGCGLWSCKLQR